jgi:two-component system, OmpR family, alkaline phosphatase synthesis response regulator PhoP
MKKILIIDDDEDFLEWLSTGLIRDGYTLLTALSGKAGLHLIASEHPDLVIADIQLPDIDGFEICRRIRESEATHVLPVILVTGVFKEVEAKEKGYALGADDFLVKPFSYDQLRIRVARRIGSSEAR